jgi:23S rRNA (guanosine2251-2'-O)-methyltransferase
LSSERFIYGFHTVTSRIRARPESVRELYVDEARADKRLKALLDLAQSRGVRVIAAASDRLTGMTGGAVHQGVVARAEMLRMAADVDEVLDALQEPALLLLLDGIQDPHNLGACLRVADAMGAHAVIAPKDRAVGLTPAAAKVASGAAETVPYLTVTNLARTMRELKARDVWLIGADQNANVDLPSASLHAAVGLVMGAEGGGLRRLTREQCDVIARIPMLGSVESLNASVAAGICLYEARRQRALRDR